jgi:membrane fusion protein (multidrug efflux system)
VADQNEQQQPGGEQGQTAQISGTVRIQQQGQPQGGESKPAQTTVEETPEKKSNKRLIAIVVVAVLICAALVFYWRSTFTEDTDDAQVDGNLYQVSARVAGQVVHVDVEEEQFVHAGDPIAEVDPKDYEVALEQAQANLAVAQAQYQEASVNVPITNINVRTTLTTSGSDVLGSEASVEQAEAQAQAARARVQSAKATALKSQLDVDRYTPLVAKDVISKQQYDAAVAQATADQAALDEAERNVKAQQDMVHQAQQKLANSQSQEQQSKTNGPKQVVAQQAVAEAALATVKQEQAKVDQAQLNLSYTKIVAPITGIVSKKSVAVGANLSVGQSLMTIVPLQDLWVTANFKETQLKEMKVGQKVKIEVDALGGRKFTGVVQQVGGATGSSLSLFPPENATGNYVKVVQRIPVRINFTNLDQENKDFALRIGMSVTPVVRVKD